MLTSPICGKSVVTVKADERKHPILTKLPMFKDWCQMDAAFELVDNHPEGAIIGMNDPDNMLKNHIRTKDGKFHTWCKEIDEYMERITPEAEEEAATRTTV